MSYNLEKYYAQKKANKIANFVTFGFFTMPLLLLILASFAFYFALYQQEKFYNQRFDFLIQQIKHCKTSESKEIINLNKNI